MIRRRTSQRKKAPWTTTTKGRASMAAQAAKEVARAKKKWQQFKRSLQWKNKTTRRRRVAPISHVRQVKARLYADVRAQFLTGQRCAVFPSQAATEVHHMRGRAGTLYFDSRFFLAVSRSGHQWIDRNMATARAAGFLCALGEYNTAPDDAQTQLLKEMLYATNKPK